MSYLRPCWTSLGPLNTGKVATARFRLIGLDLSTVADWSSVNVEEMAVPGAYCVNGGYAFPDDFNGYVEWSVDSGVTVAGIMGEDLLSTSQQISALLTYQLSQLAAVTGAQITLWRGDTLAVGLAGLGDLSARTKLWFSVKARPQSDADTDALIQITESVGLLYLLGAAATAGQGSLVVTDAATGAVTVTVAAAATLQLAPGSYSYDLQMLTPTGVQTLSVGRFVVSADVTRAVS